MIGKWTCLKGFRKLEAEEALGMILSGFFFFPSKKGTFTEVMIIRKKDWKKLKSFRHVDFELLVKFPSRDV